MLPINRLEVDLDTGNLVITSFQTTLYSKVIEGCYFLAQSQTNNDPATGAPLTVTNLKLIKNPLHTDSYVHNLVENTKQTLNTQIAGLQVEVADLKNLVNQLQSEKEALITAAPVHAMETPFNPDLPIDGHNTIKEVSAVDIEAPIKAKKPRKKGINSNKD